ncbi:MAG: nucleotidyltransferase family protein [Acidobacteria bacterium]|nr:nucleotidyltransferase family protein [Acidobacteriota bacterium]
MIAAVVLAAGESSRMGRDKALLPFRGSTFLEHIVSTLRQAQVKKMVVVLGHHAQQVQGSVKLGDTEVVVNPRYREGQTTSLQAGLLTLNEEVEGILLCLVDHPLLSVSLVRKLIEAFQKQKSPAVIPTYKGERGHPVIFARALFSGFQALGPDEGANLVARRHRAETAFLEVDDATILRDIDTLADYEKLIAEER